MTALCLTACQQADLSEDAIRQEQQEKTKKFTFHVKGAFQADYADMSRAAVRLEDNNTACITDLWALDYAIVPGESSPVLAQQVHQSPNDEAFGMVTMNLAYGSHVIKFIASKGDTPVLSASALSWAKVKDTFTLDYPVEVVASSNGNRAPELKRAISDLQISMTDVVPAEATAVKVKLSKHYKSLLLPSLATGESSEYENTFTLSSANIGKGLNFHTYTLCPSSEAWKADVTVTAIGQNSTALSTFTIKDVELKQNRSTILKGEVFSRGSGFSILIDDTWDEGVNVEF